MGGDRVDSDLSGKAVPQALPEHRQLWSGLSCAIAASRGHACAYERAIHLARDTLNGTAADATLSSNLQHTLAAPQLTLDLLFQGWVYPWPAKLLTRIHGADQLRAGTGQIVRQHIDDRRGESAAPLIVTLADDRRW